jgi:ATP-dependent protease Clp ATPase subunit
MKAKIIGQQNLEREMVKIFEIFTNSQTVIRPHFILTGPSGSGKSFTISNIAKQLKLNFIEINAAQLTKEGTSGNSLSKALMPLANTGGKPTIVFVDEFDKLFISGNNNSDLAHESTNGVQNEFLKVLEADETAVFGDYGKYVNVSSKNCLFVFAGAFNGEDNITIDRLRALGLKTEFLGRVGLIYNTRPLSLEDLFDILDTSETLNNYLRLFKDADREKTVFTLKAHLQEIHKNNTLGARVINTLLHQYFIKGGVLTSEDVKDVTFQQPMYLSASEDFNDLD